MLAIITSPLRMKEEVIFDQPPSPGKRMISY
jgi:hypothetical protein